MVGGEYAVLAGAPAVVAAVQARARVHFVTAAVAEARETAAAARHEAGDGWDGTAIASPERFPEAFAARRLAEQALGPVPGRLAVDVSALRRAGQKLGVGSSAAAAAAASAAVHAWHGADVAAPEVRARALRFALEGHREVAPRGSGADVAAAALGGFVRFRRPGGVEDPAYEAAALPAPEGLSLRVVWTGEAASTRELIAKVEALRVKDPALHGRCMDRLADEAAAFVSAFETGVARPVVDAAARYHAAMKALGEAADAPIVEARLDRAATLAAAHGGAAKPSGAGGGDVALAFFESGAEADAFTAAAASAGLTPLALRLGGPGPLPGDEPSKDEAAEDV